MTQIAPIPWIPLQVRVTDRGSDLILENPIPLASYPHNIGVWLRQNAERFPDHPFILQRNATGEWHGPTYAETLARVNRLSNGLLAQGLDGARPLAIMSENSVEMALLQLAAMQVGVPAIPISYAYSVLSQTGGHIKHILDVTGVPVVVMSNADIHMAKLSQWDTSALHLFAVSNSERHPGVQPLAALEAGHGTLTAAGGGSFSAGAPQNPAQNQFPSRPPHLPK